MGVHFPLEVLVTAMLTGLQERESLIEYSTAQSDGSTVIDEINAWFQLR
jgi:hypothetical protein